MATTSGTSAGAGMVQRFAGGGHDTVIGGDNQDGDVGALGAARAHGSEGFVPGRVKESQNLSVVLGLVGADVLGDAAGFAFGNRRFTDGVEQGGFAMVHMA